MVRIAQYSHILMNVEEASLAVRAIDFQGKSNLFVEKDVYLHYQLASSQSNYCAFEMSTVKVL